MPFYQDKNKDGNIIKDSKGNSWYYRCYYTDLYGNRKQKKSRKFKTKTEAQIAERTFLLGKEKDNEIDRNVDFSTVYNNWLEYKKNKVKSTTFYCIKKKTDKHILNYFIKYKLYSIKMNVLNSWKNDLMERNLCTSSTNAIIGYLNEILKYSNIYYEYDIKLSHCLIKIRDDSPKIKKKNSEDNFLTITEFSQFIKTVDIKLYRIVFLFLFLVGPRIGELLALTWEDIDLKNKVATINKTLSHDTFDFSYTIVSPKTNNSIRKIDIDDYLNEILILYKNEQKQIFGFQQNWFVFGGSKPLSLTTLRRYFNKYIEKSNVKKITLHGLRHSNVSMLIYLGCDVYDVAERIGDTIEMVESTYYHMFPQKKKDIVDKLNNLKF